MSSIEERLARDIAAVTGGVVVTDEDLRVARTAVDERIDGGRRRRVAGVAAAAAAAVVVAVVGVTALQNLRGDEEPAPLGPEPTTDPYAAHLTGDAPTPQALDGIWRVDNGMHLMIFHADGRVEFDHEGLVFHAPDAVGTYEVDGDRISVNVTDDERGPCRFEIRSAMPEPGVLHYVVEGSDASCARMETGVRRLEQVVPASRPLTEYDIAGATGWAPLTDKSQLHGFLFNEGGGFGLELSPVGDYIVADGAAEPVDSGQWVLRGQDLILTSGGDSPTCKAGDRLVLSNMEYLPDQGLPKRGKVARNDCGGAWAVPYWMVIPSDLHR